MKQQNLILITIDALRLDHLSFIGYKKRTTPFIDKLAKNGYFFKNAISNAPWTIPSFSSIFTSTYPFHRGGYSPLPESKITLAEILQLNGYFTMGLHSTPLLSRFQGFDRGFNLFYDSMFKKENNIFKSKILNKLLDNKLSIIKFIDFFQPLSVSKRFQYYIVLKLYKLLSGNIEYYQKAEFIFNKAYNWLKKYYYNNGKSSKSPFFLWIHLMDTHDPYLIDYSSTNPNIFKSLTEIELKYLHKHPEYTVLLQEYDMHNKLIELYDAEIQYLDKSMEQFFKLLEDSFDNIFENTLIVITADHGEEFNERGSYGHFAKLYDELLKIPLIFYNVKLNDSYPPGKIIDNLINMRDFAPTILDLLNIPPSLSFDGQSFKKIFYGESFNDDEINNGIFSETYHSKGALKFNKQNNIFVQRIISYRTKKWKYIVNEDGLKEELYDLETDPNEKVNLAKNYPELIKIFRKKILLHIKEKDIQTKNIIDIREKLKISKAVKIFLHKE